VAAAKECAIDSCRCLAALRAGRALVRDLRCVDADVADTLDAAIDPHVDRVTVVDVKNDRLERGRRVSPRRGARRCCEEGHRADETIAHGPTITRGRSRVNV